MKPEHAKNGPEVEAHFLELLKTIHTGTLVTHGPGGTLKGRPMSIARVEDDGVLWFFTSAETGKIAELASDQRALVSLAESDKYVVLDGGVALVRDVAKARALWKEAFRVWFSGPEDPKLTLLRFEPETGEYWNDAGAQGLKQAFRAAKAYVKGEQLEDVDDPGVHGKLHT
ncbi:MAG TPA: pyridoxamine 5'-phosphate oxidase family protein [Polyangiaceae bacterium]|nr:pyridoxamine 5'-phosphate oxidase family protein [Polyangiaceae bacterium]